MTVTPGPATQPTWSSNGLRVSYVDTTSGKVYVANGDGSGGATPVLTTAGAIDPAWSPNGAALAFVRVVSGHREVFKAPLDGNGVANGPEVRLTSSTVGDRRHPSWSSDSNTIVYSSTQDGGVPLLYAMAGEGTNQTKLGPAGGIPGDTPAFSPDGSSLVYAVPTGATGAGNLDTIAAGGGGSATTIDAGAANANPDWQATTSSGGSGPPVNTEAPEIVLSFEATAPSVGDYVSATVGTWDGAFPINYTYQWKHCDGPVPADAPCYAIPFANSSLLYVTPDLFGKSLRVEVKATNSLGSAAQNSDASEFVTAVAPRNRDSPPLDDDDARTVGQPVGVGPGNWDGSQPLTITYQWRRCGALGTLSSCVPIAGATDATYIPTVDDIGSTLRCYVTATNFVGSFTQWSNHTFPIIDRAHFAPSSQTEPAITGVPQIGRRLVASRGTFDGDTPIATSLEWQRCDAIGTACRAIPSATKGSYYPKAADLGSTLRLAVSATNAYGKTVAFSQPTEPVTAAPPHRRGRHIVGTNRSDYLLGTQADDVIKGLGGNDTINGNGGYDTIDGGAGNDVITATGAGTSHVAGGAGSDTIYAANGFTDYIDCGTGRDRAVIDAVDVVKNCEIMQTGTTGSGSGSGS